MRTQIAFLVVAALFAAFTITTQPSAQADTFGTSGNEFTIDFVNIGNAGNAAQSSTNRSHAQSGGDGRGSVAYEYRVGKYEVPEDAIARATASGMSNVTAGAWTGKQSAANISWYEAAAFVNWLNTSTGNQAAYDLIWNGSSWSMNLWSAADAWSLGGTNLFRHKNASYFLPSDNEWYKAAYYNPTGSNYFLWPTASDSTPTSVQSGTNAGTAVYDQVYTPGPADVDAAGGLSPYGTMGQGGNMREWNETASDGTNNSTSEGRPARGGLWHADDFYMRSSDLNYGSFTPETEGPNVGFRVASVPEPSTYALLIMTGAGALWLSRRKR